ncbi:MAG: PSD1 and planctomycete cytochrome C domain-containing protein, partial [Flavobacteriaceae bacterium]
VEGGLSLHTAAGAYQALGQAADHAAIVPFNTEKSSLVDRIYSTDAAVQMPPPESNLSLEDYEKEILKKWIAQGAVYKEHWAFIKPEKQEVPKIQSDWGSNEIDAFVLKKMRQKGLSPSEPADKATLARRVYLDLTGLPPSPEEIEEFINDTHPKAYENLIESLFKTDDYAEHMTAEWLSIARYADTHGYQDDFERTMWPWRDWVIHAFKKNMPYDQFVTYQLAGDQLPEPTKEQLLATGFNRNHKITFEGGVIPEEYRVEYVEDRTNTFGTAFLGLTMECARCHDHKYDPISQKNHFELFSFFNNLDEKGLVSDRNEVPAPRMKVSEQDIEGVLSFINNRGVSGMAPKKEMELMVMRDMEQARPTFILNRGAYDQPSEQVFPSTPEKILPFPEEFPKNRLGLSKWLFHKDHPLTARVAVNRIWQRFFGNGLVASSYDFGNQGSLPTHPELLDFLAIKYREEGWNTNQLISYILQSDTYKQSSKITSELLEIDPENKWLARATRMRLSAETIRDQALAISGLLVKEVGGPSVKPYQPEGLWKETTGGGGGSTANYVIGSGEDLYRKSIYTFWKRTVPPPSMLTFDASNRDLCQVKTAQTNTPLQALVLLNDPQMIEASRQLAWKASRKNEDLVHQLNYMYLSATGHEANEKIIGLLKNLYQDMLAQVQSNAVNTEAYLSIGQKQLEDLAPTEEFSALSLTAHTILNLDQTITRS